MPDLSPAVPEPAIPIAPSVSFESRVTSGISIEVLNAFQGVQPRGNEAGGILLGRSSGETILVEDFEPVLCEHRSGPSYVLSDEDLRGLEESVQWFRAQAGGLQVLGFYRSQVRPESLLDERDNELMRRFCGTPGSLFLLLKPGRGKAITAELFTLREGSLRPAGHPMLFPSGAGISGLRISGMPAHSGGPALAGLRSALPDHLGNNPGVPEGAADAVPRPQTAEDAAIRRASLPPARPRSVETQEIVSRNWTWVAAVVALTIAAAALGYRSVTPRNPAPAPEAVPGAASTSPVSSAMPAPAPGSTARIAAGADAQPAVPPEAEQEIREALAQWERAVRSGDPNLIAACYAPQLDRYFQQRNSSNDEVRRAAVQSVARYGKPAILRISELTLIPVSEGRAIASFRKHWQTSGPRIFAGEGQERLTLVKAEDVWKIASEEQTKVYWTQRPRG